MRRLVLPEQLDELPPEDPRARRSRADLRRVHVAMGTHGLLMRSLRSLRPPRRVLELGAGDGRLMLGAARALGTDWPEVELVLLDRQAVVEPATLAAYARAGWRASPQVVDVLDWATAPAEDLQGWDLIVAVLFLHHFEGDALSRLLAAVARRSRAFVALEPRRDALSLAGSHLVGLIGANAVTRHDAVASVRAGFRDQELSMRWPAEPHWSLREQRAGPFGHALVARRSAAPGASA